MYKSNIRYCIYRAILGLAVGLFLLIKPAGSLPALVRIIAIVFMFSGLFSLYFAWKRGKEMENALPSRTASGDKGLQRLLILTAFICVAFALVLFIFPTFFAGLSMFLVGVMIVLAATSQFMSVVQFKKSLNTVMPWYAYAAPLFVMALGIVILCNPLKSALTMTIIAGVVCVLYAALEIVQALTAWRLSKETPTA